MSETIILCEGYYDRAFWNGLLQHLGCNSLRPKPGGTVLDPFNTPVRGGAYAYRSVTGRFLRVSPCEGKDEVKSAALVRLKERIGKPLEHLIINVDSDLNADGTPTVSATMNRQSMENLVRQIDPGMTADVNGTLLIDGGATLVSLIRWDAHDVPAPGVPNQQTLERLVCAAICATYPSRGECVQSWLDARQMPPALTAKEYVWSHMAGWYAGHGCDDFYRCLWNDSAIVAELQSRLEKSGVWPIIEQLAT